MFPSPAIRRWSSSTAFTGAVRPASAPRNSANVKSASIGSGPSRLINPAVSSTTRHVPNLRRSAHRRSWPPSSTRRARSNGSVTAPEGRQTIRPVIRRWTTSVLPSSMANSKYLPRRPRSVISRPMRLARTASIDVAASRWIVAGSISTASIRRPVTRGARSRRIVSTSGSSGTVEE